MITRLMLLFLVLRSMTPLLAAERLAPHQRMIMGSHAARPDARFCFALPAGPDFTEPEKQAQRDRGKDVLSLVRRSFEAGASEVRIPRGDYRFCEKASETAKGVFLVDFVDMQRDVEHPFVIDATGATFWFDLGEAQMPPGGRCVRFQNCRNIVFRGAVLDRGSRGCIEGCITRIDRSGNRFEIQPSPGVVVPTRYRGSDEQRLLPFKSDGRFCAPLYDLHAGIRKLRYKDITPSEGGRYWVTMLSPDLINRIHDGDWERAYGDLGVLRVGDGLSCLYTTAAAISLVDSANLTMHDIGVYIAKGGPSEFGGDGGHLWKDCYFGPRPGTSQWKGADGFLCRSTRHGSTLDNVTIRHTADDVFNVHGIWAKVKAVSGRSITIEANAALRPTLSNARPGDRLRFIHRKTGRFLGEAALKSRKELVITLDRDASPFADGQAEWPEHRCAGWTVQNCVWEDNFQRLLIMSGPGAVRRCTFARMGSCIDLNTGMGLVGGVPSDITIADSSFIDVNPRPRGSMISARAHNALGQDGVPPIEGLVIRDNAFVRPGGPAMSLTGIDGGRIDNNRFESPMRATAVARPTDSIDRQAVLLRRSRNVALHRNMLADPGKLLIPAETSKSTLLSLDETGGISLDGRSLTDTPRRERP